MKEDLKEATMKIHVLDTSVILHNWNVLIEEGTGIIPQCVLDDIDSFQNEPGDVGDNARSAKRWLLGHMDVMASNNEITKDDGKGRIIFWADNDERSHDLKVIYTANDAKNDKFLFNDDIVILTKSISLRVKANGMGIETEDYDDVGLIQEIDGWREMPISVEEMESILQDRSSEEFFLPGREDLAVNEYVICACEGKRCGGMIYRHIENGRFQKIDLKPHLSSIVPRSPEQVMLANSLLDKNIPLVSSIGRAGSGKTLLAVSAAIQQVLIKPKLYDKIIITRPIMPVGKDIGYLPGDVNEKMAEWVRPFMNNIEYIKKQNEQKGKGKVSMEKISPLMDLASCKDIMEVLPLTYIRGCSISNAFIIVDEAQNATPSEMRTIITRVGEGSKLVLMGDIDQIDNRFLSRDCNGLTMAIKKFWNHSLYSHITLRDVERSPLAELATKILF